MTALCLGSITLCACAEVPQPRPEYRIVAASTAPAAGQAVPNDVDAVSYEGVDLGADNMLGRGWSAYPTHMIGPLVAKASRHGTKYCGKGQVSGIEVLVSMCFSMAELREMHASVRYVRIAKAEPRYVVRLASAN